MTDQCETLSRRCDDVIAKHNLLYHSFYQRWTEGTLPVPALKDYAREYGMFIRIIAQGWERIGKPETARTEAGHAKVWEGTFAAGLETSVTTPEVREVTELLEVAGDLFGDRATALGALYAFEAQQPVVAKAKLQGLREHYKELSEKCEEYFRLHTEDYDEVSVLSDEMGTLSSGDQSKAFNACQRMAQALYDALTGIEAPYVEDRCYPV